MFDIRPTAQAAAQASSAHPLRIDGLRPAGVLPLVWKLASPQERVRLLRHHHALGVLHKLHGHGLPGGKLGHLFGHRLHGFARLGAELRAQAQLRREQGDTALSVPARLAGAAVTPAPAQAASASAAPASPASAPSPATTAAAAAPLPQGARTPAEAQSLAQITQQFQARFTRSARDPAAFNALLKQAFGDKFDAAKAETLRQQALAGDFSWMPKIQLADPGQLKDTTGAQGEGYAMGCYSAGEDTVYLNRDLLASDPAQAEKILAEEVGHALDARLNTTDAAGDEGDIFSKLVHGETLSASQLAEMKADNDHGVIEINGKKTEVEYGWFKKLRKAISGGLKKVVKAVTNGIKQSVKAAFHVAQGLVTMNFSKVRQGLEEGVDAVKDTVKDVAKAVKDTAKAIHKIVKEAAIKLMQSKIFNAILMVAHFIPVLNAAALIIDAVKAAYMVYQGVKYKSLSMVLAGVASLATSAAGISANYGFNNLAGTLTKVGNWAGNASQAYNAIAKKDLGAALGLMGMDGLSKGVSAVQAAKNGDTLGALATAATVGGKITGSETLRDAGQVLLGAKAVHELEQGNFDAAHGAAQQMDAAKAAQDTSIAQRAQARQQAAQAEAAAQGPQAEGPEAAPKEESGPQDQGDAPRNAPKEPQTVTIKRGQTLEGLAREHYGADWRAGLAQMALDNNLQANRWGSPMLREGQDLVISDISERSDSERQALGRAGGQVVARNQQGLDAKAQMEALAAGRAQALRDAPSTASPLDAREPSPAMTAAEKAQADALCRKPEAPPYQVPAGTPEMRAWDPAQDRAREMQLRRSGNDIGIQLLGPVFGGWAAGARLAGAPEHVVEGLGEAQFGLVGSLAAATGRAGTVSGRAVEPRGLFEIEVRNGVAGAERSGSANKTDALHAFPDLVDNSVTYAQRFSIPTRGAGGAVVRQSDLYQAEGSLNGRSGVFEWIVDREVVTHRRFIPDGQITGQPNQTPNKK